MRQPPLGLDRAPSRLRPIEKRPFELPLILAPLATVSHAAFRTLIEELGGCDLYFNEMISASAFLGGAAFESYYLDSRPDPRRLVHQIVGYTAGDIVRCAEGLAAHGVYGIDVNMGCSAPQIVRKGGGIAWMRDRLRTSRLVSDLRKALPGVRLSAKLRLGDADDVFVLYEFVRALEDAGLDYVTLHPKTRKEGEHRPARWRRIGDLQRRVRIPVIGNGNVVDRETYERRIAEGEPSAVMIGRGAVRQPWIFAAIRSARGTDNTTTRAVRAGAIDLRRIDHRFRELLEELQPEEFWPTRAKRFYRYYSANFTFGYRLGAQIQNLRSYGEMIDLMDRYYEEHPEEVQAPVHGG